MGHERIGILPKTKRWDKVVGQISTFSSENNNVARIAQDTLKNVRGRFEGIEHDSGVQAAFQFLVFLSHSSKQDKPQDFFSSQGITLSENLSPIQVAKAINDWVSKNSESNEYASVAQGAAIDTISEWYQKNKINQAVLFPTENESQEIWRKTGDGSGFCELSRLYFSKFTERYLKYFLERAASAKSNSISDRNLFGKELEKHIKDISNHAFETAKITQSFAAGWFNKYAINDVPTKNKIQKFLAFAFGKMRAELLREENRD